MWSRIFVQRRTKLHSTVGICLSSACSKVHFSKHTRNPIFVEKLEELNENRQWADGVQLIKETKLKDLAKDESALRVAVYTILQAQDEHFAKQLFSSLSNQPRVLNSFLQPCLETSNLNLATYFFSQTPEENMDSTSFKLMMHILINNGRPEMSFQLFDEMKKRRMNICPLTFSLLIKACNVGNFPNKIEEVKAEMAAAQISWNPYVLSGFIKGCKTPDDALLMLEAVKACHYEIDVGVYNSVMGVLAPIGDNRIWQIYDELKNFFKPSQVTFIHLFHWCKTTNQPDLAHTLMEQVYSYKADSVQVLEAFLDSLSSDASALEVFDAIAKAGFVPTTHMCVSTLQAWSVIRRGDLAQFLQKMNSYGVKIDTRIFNAIIHTCTKTKDVDFAIKTFHEMHTSGVKPDDVTFATLVNVLVEADHPELKNIVAEIKEQQGQLDPILRSTLLKHYRKKLDVASAQELFPNFADHTMASASLMLGIYFDASESGKFFAFYTVITRPPFGIQPDRQMLTLVMKACIKFDNLDLGKKTYRALKTKTDAFQDAAYYTILLRNCQESQRFQLAQYIWTDMNSDLNLKVNSIHYAAWLGVLFTCSSTSNEANAIETLSKIWNTYEDMKVKKVTPNKDCLFTTYNSLERFVTQYPELAVSTFKSSLTEKLLLLDQDKTKLKIFLNKQAQATRTNIVSQLGIQDIVEPDDTISRQAKSWRKAK